MHRARVVHNDPYPKDVLIVPGWATDGSDRVVWIDFDIALNFGSQKVGERLQYDETEEAVFEKKLVESYGMMLVSLALYNYILCVKSQTYSGRGSEARPAEEYGILLKVRPAVGVCLEGKRRDDVGSKFPPPRTTSVWRAALRTVSDNDSVGQVDLVSIVANKWNLTSRAPTIRKEIELD